jgi:hypothetical protein
VWFFAGNGAAGVSRDNGLCGVPPCGNRFWDYTFTFTPPKIAPDGTVLTGGALIDIMAVIVDANGDGIMTTPAAPLTITLTNP